MKINKFMRTVASVGISAAALSAAGICASADVIDFEDGNFDFVIAYTEDGGDASVLSVEEFNGSKQLKVDVQDKTLSPKIQFDLNSIVGTDNLSDVSVIQMEVTIASKDGTTPPGWIGGALGTVGPENSPAWAQSDYSGEEYENPVAETILIERKFLLPSQKLVSGTEGTTALLMRWSADVDYYMYVDNVKFLDADGNEMALNVGGAAAEAEAPAETEAAAETAPASDNTTDSTATGNVPAAALAAVAALAAAAAVTVRKKK